MACLLHIIAVHFAGPAGGERKMNLFWDKYTNNLFSMLIESVNKTMQIWQKDSAKRVEKELTGSGNSI